MPVGVELLEDVGEASAAAPSVEGVVEGLEVDVRGVEQRGQEADRLRGRVAVREEEVEEAGLAGGLDMLGYLYPFGQSDIPVSQVGFLGIAVALPEGLIVPVLRGVNHMGFREIRVRSADLVERARAPKLKQDELNGATFTVSNLGMFGVDAFQAIVNTPQAAILAVGATDERAVVRDGELEILPMVTLTATFDHRAVDGADGAEFLATVKAYLEEPALAL